ncbi:hypothetical protein C2G38_2089891 [Gigaspora rosea]|uniref:Uncharacterized protein n=1 Tax=Gigaspora rosea TaxID=44941 RepID=A0A397V2W9_9GLOM|nr:hypothetical protein C2G38_2089891 [Gigaspora rosea]
MLLYLLIILWISLVFHPHIFFKLFFSSYIFLASAYKFCFATLIFSIYTVLINNININIINFRNKTTPNF